MVAAMESDRLPSAMASPLSSGMRPSSIVCARKRRPVSSARVFTSTSPLSGHPKRCQPRSRSMSTPCLRHGVRDSKSVYPSSLRSVYMSQQALPGAGARC